MTGVARRPGWLALSRCGITDFLPIAEQLVLLTKRIRGGTCRKFRAYKTATAIITGFVVRAIVTISAFNTTIVFRLVANPISKSDARSTTEETITVVARLRAVAEVAVVANDVCARIDAHAVLTNLVVVAFRATHAGSTLLTGIIIAIVVITALRAILATTETRLAALACPVAARWIAIIGTA